MKHYGLKYKDIAEITGLTYGSVKNALKPDKPLPPWAKMALYVWWKQS